MILIYKRVIIFKSYNCNVYVKNVFNYNYKNNIEFVDFFLYILCFAVTAGACSHLTAIHYFAQSVLVKNVFKSVQCNNWNEYETGKCGEPAKINFMGEYVDMQYV